MNGSAPQVNPAIHTARHVRVEVSPRGFVSPSAVRALETDLAAEPMQRPHRTRTDLVTAAGAARGLMQLASLLPIARRARSLWRIAVHLAMSGPASHSRAGRCGWFERVTRTGAHAC